MNNAEHNNAEVTLDDLAVMVKNGFEAVDKRFVGIDKQFEAVDKRFVGINKRFDGIDKQLKTLADGQEDIKLKLDNVPHRFELSEVEKRVEVLERKVK